MKTNSQTLELPSPPRLLGGCFAAVIGFVLLRLFAGGGIAPSFWSLGAPALAVCFLFGLGRNREPTRSFMRAGFHLGGFAFFMFYPLIDSANVAASVPPSLRDLIGLMIVLMVIGFEFGYWGTRFDNGLHAHEGAFELSPRHRKQLAAMIYLGLGAWFLTLLDSAISSGVSLIDMILTMRGQVAGANEDAAPLLGGPLILLQRVLAGGGFLAATASLVLLTGRQSPTTFTRLVCWATLLVCAAAGFLSGSRGVFFYAFAPLAVTSWLLMSRSNLKGSRWLWASVGFALIIASWSAMSVLRGGDIRLYAGDVDLFSPEEHARGALDIYSQLSLVVQGFPEVIPYQKGQSLVPLVLGWVPRSVWPDKPYPFSLFMNFLNGESLERRAASLAVGIPGEGYGNFGLLGVFLWAALAGFVSRRGDDYIGNFHPDHPLRLLLAAMAGIWISLIVRGGIPEMFYMGLAAIMLPWALAVYLNRVEHMAVARPRPAAPPQSPARTYPPGPIVWPTEIPFGEAPTQQAHRTGRS